jgi:hypothetical protein
MAIFIVLVFGASAAVVLPQEQKYADDPLQKVIRGEVDGLSELSLLRADHARRALEEVRKRSPSESLIQDLTIRPTFMRMSVEVPADGSLHAYTVGVGFKVEADEPRDASSDYGLTFRRVDMSVPERMATIVLDQLHRPTSDIDYVVLSISSGETEPDWLLFLKHGRVRDRTWRASSDGTNIRRNGT